MVLLCPRAVRDPRCRGKQAHGEQAPAQEGSISHGGPAGKGPRGYLRHQCLRAWGAVCSVTNGIVAGFCRLQLPDIASQDAVKAGVQAGLHVSLLPAFSPFLSLYAVLLFFLV